MHLTYHPDEQRENSDGPAFTVDFTAPPKEAQHPGLGETEFMARNERNVVNLDALITRADLFGDEPPVKLSNKGIRIDDLGPCVMYDLLRKPDFQRETANWNPDQVATLIKTFADQDIIPSLIFWQNGAHIFVIDGAHRLSALIAWVRDDYGAGELSRKTFETIPAHQLAMHEETRRLVNDKVGTWAAFHAKTPLVGMKELHAQWIENNTPLQAGEAFIRINQGGTEISPLEVRILRAPKAALSVATRAIPRGGSGHAYWQHFSSSKAREETPGFGKEIHDLLFEPAFKTPIKTMDLPIAGSEYGMGVVRLAFDLVALSNGLKIPDSTSRSVTSRDTLPADMTGEDTVRYLKRARAEIRRVLSTDPSSFGLHPALYFYTGSGVFQPAALLNMVAWLRDLDKRNALSKFRKSRGRFEALLIAHPVIMKPPLHLLGTGGRTRTKMLNLFDAVLDAVSGSDDLDAVWRGLIEKYSRLFRDEGEENEAIEQGSPGGKFKASTKSAISFGDISLVPKCPLCGGLLHPNGKVMDHPTKKEDGGGSGVKDGRWVHPVCNSERDKDEREAANAAR